MEPLFEHVGLSIVGAGCKNRCKHCAPAADLSEPVLLSLEQIEGAVSAVRAENEKAPAFYKHIHPSLSYEPMDHPDVVEIHGLLSALNRQAVNVRTMATNGQRVGADPAYPEMVRALRDQGLERFQLSLYGLERTHDWFAGRRGAYRSIMEAARRIASLGVEVDWVYFLHKRNVGEFCEMVEAARGAAEGTTLSESINIWGPVGRAAKQGALLVTAADLERVPAPLRTMRMLPQYLPEAAWVESARTGEMQSLLDDFRRRMREFGGLPDCNLRVDSHNVADFAKVLQEERAKAMGNVQGKPETDTPSGPDVSWLAEKYGDKDGQVLYRLSTMRQEWLRRHREAGVRPARRTGAS